MKLPELHTVPRIVEKAKSRASFDVVTQLVFNAIDGRTTIAAIGERCGLEPALVQRIVLRIFESGLVAVDGFEPESKDKGPEAQAGKPTEVEGDMDRLLALPDSTVLYELLDVQPDVSRSELRTRYFGLSKRFHPDRLPAGSGPDLKRKAEFVFRRLTAAYDTLSNPHSREEYDQSIADHLELWKIEKQLKSAIDSKRSGAASTPPAAPKSDPPGPEPPVERAEKKPAPVTPSRPVRRPERVERPRVSRPAPVRPTPAPPPEPLDTGSYPPRADYDARRRAYKRERAGKAIQDFFKRPSSVPPVGPKGAEKAPLKPGARPGGRSTPAFDPRKTVPHLRDAEIALERSEFSKAIEFLDRTLAYAPFDTKALHMLELAKAGRERARIQEHLVSAKKEQHQGNWSEALKLYRKVVVLDPNNLEAKHLLCDLMIEKRQDLPGALNLAKEVVEKGGEKARYFATLGEIYLLAGDLAEAEKAFLKALEKEPENKQYKKRLKACKR